MFLNFTAKVIKNRERKKQINLKALGETLF